MKSRYKAEHKSVNEAAIRFKTVSSYGRDLKSLVNIFLFPYKYVPVLSSFCAFMSLLSSTVEIQFLQREILRSVKSQGKLCPQFLKNGCKVSFSFTYHSVS